MAWYGDHVGEEAELDKHRKYIQELRAQKAAREKAKLAQDPFGQVTAWQTHPAPALGHHYRGMVKET